MPTKRIEPDASAPKRDPVDVQALRTLVKENADWRLVIHRDALPACLDEIEDLLKDKARLDWLDSHRLLIAMTFRHCDATLLPRAAIDAALRGEPKEGM